MATATKDQEKRSRAEQRESLHALFGRELLQLAEHADRPEIGEGLVGAWPDPYWQDKPEEFCRRILGFEPWEKQIEVLDLVLEAIAESLRVAIASGHKVGKSVICAALALWAYCSFPGVRVVLTAVTSRQVDGIIWREVRMLLARHGRCVECRAENARRQKAGEGLIGRPCVHSRLIGEEAGELAKTGLKAEDFREIVGFTAKESEAVAGVSGPFLVYIVDEASGVPQIIYDAIEGNRAGGALVVLIGNPTKLHGEHFEAFHGKAAFYKTLRISSEETPNVKTGRRVIPGLATREWIEEKKREWGEKSPLYLVRVKGQHPKNEKGAIFSLEALQAAVERHEETPAEGSVLTIGIDVAGSSGMGDESAFSARRGKRQLELRAKLGLTAEGHLIEALGLVAKYRQNGDEVRIAIDRDGEPGSKVWGVFVGYLASLDPKSEPPFQLVGVRSSERAYRDPKTFDRVRDELAAALADWIGDGGAILDDAKLQAELVAMRWVDHVSGRQKLISKEGRGGLREILGRSPDRADALALCVWAEGRQAGAAPAPTSHEAEPMLDPYDHASDYAGGMDPYAFHEQATGGRRR